MMRICSKCQSENDKDQKFCSKCGGSLESELARFLTDLGLSEHFAVFEKNDLFTIAELKALSEDDISELQSKSGEKIPFGDRVRLRKALALLSEGSQSMPSAQGKSETDRLKEMASQGDINAMFELGEIHAEGLREVDEDLAEAASWYRKASEKGQAAAQFKYAEALYYGKGVDEDEGESAKWLRMASRQGQEEAKAAYNERLEEGRFAYLIDSAEQGNGESQYRLGCLFYNGEQGHPVDKSQAASWFRKASAQEHATAQYTLGMMTLQGDGVRQDEPEGKRLIQAAAAQGYREAIDMLAQLNAAEASQIAESPAATQTQPAPSQDFINKVGNGYLMMLLYLVTCGTTSIVGVVMAYLNRGKVPEGYLRTHCRWQIRSFWFFCLWSTVGSIAVAIIEPGKVNEGALIGLIAFLWYYYRAFRGKAALKEGKPVYKDQPSKVFKPVFALIILVLLASGVLKAYKEEQKKKIQQTATEQENQQAAAEREARQRRIQAQQQSENEARLSREKAEAEEKAREAQQAAAKAEREKQEALNHAQQTEDAARVAANQAEREKQEALRRAQEAERNAEQAQQAAQQQPAASGGAQQQLPDGFADFFKQYVRDHGSNNAWDLAYDYADPCYYSYSNGNASRAYIYDDIRKLVQAYPQRSYTDVGIDNITVLSPDTVRLRYHFNYQYAGKKLARGTSTVDLEVRNFSGKWQITNFSEQVIRR